LKTRPIARPGDQRWLLVAGCEFRHGAFRRRTRQQGLAVDVQCDRVGSLQVLRGVAGGRLSLQLDREVGSVDTATLGCPDVRAETLRRFELPGDAVDLLAPLNEVALLGVRLLAQQSGRLQGAFLLVRAGVVVAGAEVASHVGRRGIRCDSRRPDHEGCR